MTQSIIGSAGSGGPANVNISPDTHPALANIINDEFEGAALDSKWTFTNQGAASATLSNGWLQLTAPAGSTQNNRIITQPAPQAPWTIRCKIQLGTDIASIDVNPVNMGFSIWNSLSSKGLDFGFDKQPTSPTRRLSIYELTSPTVYLGSVATLALGDTGVTPFIPFAWGGPIYLEIRNDGTNLFFSWSLSGAEKTYRQIFTQTLAAFIVSVNFVGLYCDAENNNAASLMCDWFRQIA